MPWMVKVETIDGEKKEFLALDTYALTEEQKLLWKTVMGEQEKITNMRIKCIIEAKIKDEQNSLIGH